MISVRDVRSAGLLSDVSETLRPLEIQFEIFCGVFWRFFEKNPVKSKLSNTNTCFLSWKTTGLLLLFQHFKAVGKQQGCETITFQKKLPVKKGLFQTPQIRSTSELSLQRVISSTMPQIHGFMKKNKPKKQFRPRFVLPYCGLFYSEPLLSVRTLQPVQPQSSLV